MRSDPIELNGECFDFLVVGGGIQGAALARELALRGSSVVLVERDDFASGTSMRSSRLVHGGVRYLQEGHLSLVREALAERERLLMLAPHLVRPLPMLMPFFADSGGRSPWIMRIGLRLYSWLARASTMPGPQYHCPEECLRLFPGLRRRGLLGGSLFFDARTEDLPLTLAVLKAAQEAGATLVNHLELIGQGSNGLLLRDRLFDSEINLRAKVILNAAGPRADQVRSRLGIDAGPLLRCSRGSHLVLAPREAETALAGFLPDDRIQFIIPHQGGTICGTTDVACDASQSEPSVPPEDLRYLLEALAFFLEDPPDESRVCFAYAGLRALPAVKGPPGGINREAFLVEESVGGVIMHTVVGGKLTTHRSFAERCVDRLLGRSDPSPSREQPLPGGDGPQDPGDSLWWRYGSRAAELRALGRGRPDLLERFAPDRDHLRVEAVYALRELGAVSFVDLVLRRLFHSQGPCLDDGVLRDLHELYLRERRVDLPNSFEQDRAELCAAVASMHGGSVLSSAGSEACPPG